MIFLRLYVHCEKEACYVQMKGVCCAIELTSFDQEDQYGAYNEEPMFHTAHTWVERMNVRRQQHTPDESDCADPAKDRVRANAVPRFTH